MARQTIDIIKSDLAQCKSDWNPYPKGRMTRKICLCVNIYVYMVSMFWLNLNRNEGLFCLVEKCSNYVVTHFVILVNYANNL